MNAERSNSATNPNPSISNARDRRVKLAEAAIVRLDICKHLLMAEPISTRLALALRIVATAKSDIADLAGEVLEEEDRRDAATIAELPRRKPTGLLQRLDIAVWWIMVGSATAFAAGWITYSAGFHLGLWP